MQPGRTLCDRFVLERELGRGCAGAMFAGRDRLLELEVRIELFELRDEPEHELELRRAAQRFAALEHPNLIPIHQFGREHELAFVVMPLVPGRSLRALLDDGPLAIPTLAEIGRQLALALAYSHARGVVHGALEARAVLVSEEPGGLAVRLAAWLPIEPGVEVRRGDPADARADLHALGILLYECVAGRPPFGGEDPSSRPLVRPGLLRAELPGELEGLILALLRNHPARRPSNAREVAERLEVYADPIAGAASLLATHPPSTGLAISFGLSGPGEARSTMLHDAVGRDRTLRAIDLRVTAARSGSLQLVLLTGEAGIGKTTVLDELALACQQREIDLLRTRATADVPGGWHGPFGELLTAGLAQRPEAIELLAPIAHRLIALFPALAHSQLGRHTGGTRREPSWAGLEPIELGSGPVGAAPIGPPGDRTARAQELVVRAFAALVANGRPLALAIDDVQLGPETVAQIERLFRRLPRAPLVLILAHQRVTAKLDDPLARLRRRLAGHPRALTIELGPLGEDVHAALLNQLLGGGQIDPRLASQLWRESGGRPVFARELVRAAVEAKLLVQRDGIWRLDALRWPIPRSIRIALEPRLRRLPTATLAALEFGSVLAIVDDTFELEPLRELLGVTTRELDQLLARALDRGLIEELEVGSRRSLRFTSEILRRIVHDALALADRGKLHRHCAERLRRQPFAEPDAHAHEIAITNHLIHAHAVADARPLVIALAHDALDDRRPERAIALVHGLIEIADGLPPVERGELQLLLAELELARVDLPAASAALERLAVILDSGDDPRLTRFGERGAELANQLDRRELADRLLGLRPRDRRAAERQRRARAELAALRPATSSRSMQIGDLLLMHGEYTAAREAYDTARRRAVAEGDHEEAARQLQRLARVASRLGHHETAIGYCREGLALLDGRRSVERVGLLAVAGFAYVVADQPERAVIELDAGAAELASYPDDLGSDRDRVAAELERSGGDHQLALGNATLAIEAYERCLALTPENDRWTLSVARFNLGQACALAGHANRALRELERSAADKRAIGDREGLAYAQLVRVQILRDLGQIADAGEWLVEARELADEIEHPRLSAQVQAEFGRHALLGGKLELANQAARAAMDLARNSHAAAELGAALELLATIDLARGDRDEAVRHASEAVRLGESREPPATAERRALATGQLAGLLVLAEASEPERRRELLDRARAAGERSANPYLELDVSLTSLRLGLGDPLHAGDEYVALEQLSARAEALGAQRHVGLCLLAQAEVLAPHDARGALDHARLGEAQLRVLGARLEADRAGELIARLTLR